MTTKYKADKVHIDERSVIRRCNRFLDKDGHRLCKNRKTRGKSKRQLTQRQIDLGTFYILDVGKKNRVVEKHVNLEEFARRNGIVAPYEVITQE
jgi:hypothetical protein